MNTTFSTEAKTTLRTAAYGAIELLSAAGAAGASPHKIATDGSIALASATGPIGHVLAEKQYGAKVKGKSVADYADRVLPALTESVRLLNARDKGEAEDFRHILNVAMDAATRRTRASATVEDMAKKINAALGAA